MRMRSVYYSAGEDIVREGEWADEMFFIVSGAVEVVIPAVPSAVAKVQEAAARAAARPTSAAANYDSEGSLGGGGSGREGSASMDSSAHGGRGGGGGGRRGSNSLLGSHQRRLGRGSSDQSSFNANGKLSAPANERRVALLGDNQFFGERAVLHARERRSATCRALVFTELRVLARAPFTEAAQNFPEILKHVNLLSKTRDEATDKKRAQTAPEAKQDDRSAQRRSHEFLLAADEKPWQPPQLQLVQPPREGGGAAADGGEAKEAPPAKEAKEPAGGGAPDAARRPRRKSKDLKASYCLAMMWRMRLSSLNSYE